MCVLECTVTFGKSDRRDPFIRLAFHAAAALLGSASKLEGAKATGRLFFPKKDCLLETSCQLHCLYEHMLRMGRVQEDAGLKLKPRMLAGIPKPIQSQVAVAGKPNVSS